MSDDTPTQKFDPSGDAPTERFTAPVADEPSEEVIEERKSRKLIIILASIGGALLIAVIVILIMLLTKNNGTPGAMPTSSSSSSASPTPSASASATPSASPTPTPTPTQDAPPPPPPPPSTDVSIDSFTGETTSECSSQTQNRVNMLIEWESTNGVAAYFAVGDVNDAETNGMGWTLPPSGNSNDFPSGYVPYEFQCGNASNTYTLTVVGTNGSRDTRTITVENTGDTF